MAATTTTTAAMAMASSTTRGGRRSCGRWRCRGRTRRRSTWRGCPSSRASSPPSPRRPSSRRCARRSCSRPPTPRRPPWPRSRRRWWGGSPWAPPATSSARAARPGRQPRVRAGARARRRVRVLPAGFVALRFVAGLSLANFVANQHWMSRIFAPSAVGLANAVAAGWANVGSAAAQVVMPVAYDAVVLRLGVPVTVAWRVTYLLPCAMLVTTGLAVLAFPTTSRAAAVVAAPAAAAGGGGASGRWCGAASATTERGCWASPTATATAWS